jgi:hypothetical protein
MLTQPDPQRILADDRGSTIDRSAYFTLPGAAPAASPDDARRYRDQNYSVHRL